MTMDSWMCHEMSTQNEMQKVKGIVIKNLVTKLDTKQKAMGFRALRANNLLVNREMDHLKAESISIEADMRYKAKLLQTIFKNSLMKEKKFAIE